VTFKATSVSANKSFGTPPPLPFSAAKCSKPNAFRGIYNNALKWIRATPYHYYTLQLLLQRRTTYNYYNRRRTFETPGNNTPFRIYNNTCEVWYKLFFLHISLGTSFWSRYACLLYTRSNKIPCIVSGERTDLHAFVIYA